MQVQQKSFIKYVSVFFKNKFFMVLFIVSLGCFSLKGQEALADDMADVSAAPAADIATSNAFVPGQGLYLSLDTGYAGTYYKNAFGGDNTWEDGSGNVFFGAQLGYQFTRYLALEGGYNFILPATATSNINSNNKSTITPQIAYGVLRTIIPVYPRLDLFLQGGIAYVHQTIKKDGAGGEGALRNQNRTRSHMGAAFGGGMHYYFTSNVYADISYRRIAGEFLSNSDSQIQRHIPDINLFTFSVGYYFGM